MNNLNSKRDMLLTLWKQAKRWLEIPAFIENRKLTNGKILIIKDAFIILILRGKNTYKAISEYKNGLWRENADYRQEVKAVLVMPSRVAT